MSLFDLISKRRFVLLLAAVVFAGCSSESWDWNWRRPESKDTAANKPVTKAKPAADQPKSAKASGKPTTATADDPQATEVNAQIEQYADRMKAGEQKGYAPNDLNSKIQRQQDPNRRNRIRKVAEESRTDQPPADQEPPTRTASDTPATAAPRTSPDSPARQATGREATAPPGETRPVAANTGKPAVEPKAKEDNAAEATPTALTGADTTALPAKPTAKKPTEEPAADSPPVLEDIKISPAPESAKPTKETKDPRKTAAPAGKPGDMTVPEPRITTTPGKDTIADEPSGDTPVATPAAAKLEKTEKPEKADSHITPRMASNTPTPGPESADTFKRRLEELEAQVKKEPNSLENQFKLRMMFLLDGQEDKAAAPIAGADADMQEVVMAHFKALIAAKSAPGRDPALMANQQLEQIETLRNMIRARADLQVPKVVLCTAIESFGRYTPIEPAEFKAGDKNRVLLYIEVDNFKSEKTASGLYRTLLNLRVGVLTTSGQEVWTMTDSNIEDLARQQRRDFYLTIGELTIDRKLAPGDYVLKAEVEDVLAGKINSSTAKFKIIP